ncbi:MAG: hypothetical protein QXU20_01920 [Candidatus Woesearchaeota archaeon]
MILDKNLQVESVLSLEKILDFDNRNNLSKEESEDNIIKNIVTINKLIDSEQDNEGKTILTIEGWCNGLRITNDGFVITAYHAIKNYIEEWKSIYYNNYNKNKNIENIATIVGDLKINKYVILDQDRYIYPIDPTFCVFNSKIDIALIKVVSMKEPEPVKFKILREELKIGEEIKNVGIDQFGVKDFGLYINKGKIILESLDVPIHNIEGEKISEAYDSFLTNINSKSGFSGSVFITENGEFAGTCLYAEFHKNENMLYNSGGAKTKYIIDLIRVAVEKLKNSF